MAAHETDSNPTPEARSKPEILKHGGTEDKNPRISRGNVAGPEAISRVHENVRPTLHPEIHRFFLWFFVLRFLRVSRFLVLPLLVVLTRPTHILVSFVLPCTSLCSLLYPLLWLSCCFRVCDLAGIPARRHFSPWKIQRAAGPRPVLDRPPRHRAGGDHRHTHADRFRRTAGDHHARTA